MFCRNCGKEILEQDRFCSYCGEKVEEEIIDLSDEAEEAAVWGVFAKLGRIFGLITLIGGCLSFGYIGLMFGEFAIAFSALGLKSKKNYYDAKKSLKIAIIGSIISTVLFIFIVYLVLILEIIALENVYYY